MKNNKNRRIATIGPWTGGLNIRDVDTDIADNELAYAMNIDIDVNGKIQQRPPIYHTLAADWGTGDVYKSGYLTPDYMIWNVTPSGNFVRTRSRPAQSITGAWAQYDSPSTAGWRSATASMLYKDYMYFILQVTTPGTSKIGKVLLADIADPLHAPTWSLINGPALQGDSTVTLIHNDRLFLADRFSNRIYYSKPTDFNIWADPDGGQFDVGESTEAISKMVSIANRIYIFKRSSIWTLDYSSDPVDDGTLQQISLSVGAFDAIAYKSRIFGVNNTGIFELVGGQVYWLSDKLGLRENLNRESIFDDGSVSEYLKGFDTVAGVKSICAVDDKLYVAGFEYVSGYNPAFNKINPILVLNIENGAWTMYGLDRVDPGETTKSRAQAPLLANETYGVIHGHSYSLGAPFTITTRNGSTDCDSIGVNGPPFASFQTKVYEFNNTQLKRLFRMFFRVQNYYWKQDGGNSMAFAFYIRTNIFNQAFANYFKEVDINVPTDSGLVADGVWHSIRARFRTMSVKCEVNLNELTNSPTTSGNSYHWEIPNIQMEVDDRAEVANHIPSSVAAPG